MTKFLTRSTFLSSDENSLLINPMPHLNKESLIELYSSFKSPSLLQKIMLNGEPHIFVFEILNEDKIALSQFPNRLEFPFAAVEDEKTIACIANIINTIAQQRHINVIQTNISAYDAIPPNNEAYTMLINRLVHKRLVYKKYKSKAIELLLNINYLP